MKIAEIRELSTKELVERIDAESGCLRSESDQPQHFSE